MYRGSKYEGGKKAHKLSNCLAVKAILKSFFLASVPKKKIVLITTTSFRMIYDTVCADGNWEEGGRELKVNECKDKKIRLNKN